MNDQPIIPTLELARKLTLEQFPQFAHLSIKPVANQGHDNRTFHLGDDMLIRLPSAECYAEQVQKEQKWLPFLAKQLSTLIPTPIAMGKPSENFPLHWSIYKWLEGESVNTVKFSQIELNNLALDLAKFLISFQQIETTDAPLPGLHNFYRGAQIYIYDNDTRSYISKLKGIIDYEKALRLWEKAINSKWNKDPVWIHGDFASGNILVKDKKLAAVIDFGCTAIGDPACDLVIAWIFLNNEARNLFKQTLALDQETWIRAKGWALWKACFLLIDIQDKTNLDAIKQIRIINELINEPE